MNYPAAKNKSKVGSYSALVFSGGGYFYDEVLEYRVWVRPSDGEEVHFYSYADYKTALDCSKETEGAE
jgi:putative acetyltransferase